MTGQRSRSLWRRIGMWTKVFLAVLALASGGACSTDQITGPANPSPGQVESPSIAQASVPRCSEDIPFEPTYLPDGFRHEVRKGAFPGGRPPDDQSSTGGKPHEEQVIVHYRSSDSRAIEIRRPGTHFTELAQGNDAPTIEVLGNETSGFAPIQPGGDDYIVQFTYPNAPNSRSHNWCSVYSLNEYGVSLAELKKVAEGLRPRSPDRRFRLLIHCGLSNPFEFEGRNWLPVDTRLRKTHNPPKRFGSDENYDVGTMRRIDDDTIIYTSSEGREVEYEPTDRRAEVCE